MRLPAGTFQSRCRSLFAYRVRTQSSSAACSSHRLPVQQYVQAPPSKRTDWRGRVLRRKCLPCLRRTLHRCCSSTQEAAQTPPGLTNMPWTGSPEQLRALEELERRIQDLPGEPPSSDTVTWFLRDRSLDVEEAAEKLAKMTAWRRRFRPEQLGPQDFGTDAASGEGYVHSEPDRYGRPVIVVRVAKHISGGEGQPEATQRLCAFLAEQALARLPPGGETVLAVFDFRGAGPKNIDLELARFLVDLFFLYYPKRLGQVLMVDTPWIFQPAWQLIKPLLRKYAELVRFVSAEEVRTEFFAPGKAPADFR